MGVLTITSCLLGMVMSAILCQAMGDNATDDIGDTGTCSAEFISNFFSCANNIGQNRIDCSKDVDQLNAMKKCINARDKCTIELRSEVSACQRKHLKSILLLEDDLCADQSKTFDLTKISKLESEKCGAAVSTSAALPIGLALLMVIINSL